MLLERNLVYYISYLLIMSPHLRGITFTIVVYLSVRSTVTVCLYMCLSFCHKTCPSKHSQIGPTWAESGHSAQIGPVWVLYWNFSQCGTHIGPLLVILFSTHKLFCPGDRTMFIKATICFISLRMRV